MLTKTIKQSISVVLPLTVLTFFVNWNTETLKIVRLFGNPDLVPASLLTGAIIGLANLKGLAWGLEGLSGGNYKASSRLVFLGLLRLVIVFALITFLAVAKLVNFLAFMAGMAIVFIILIKESLKIARKSS